MLLIRKVVFYDFKFPRKFSLFEFNDHFGWHYFPSLIQLIGLSIKEHLLGKNLTIDFVRLWQWENQFDNNFYWEELKKRHLANCAGKLPGNCL